MRSSHQFEEEIGAASSENGLFIAKMEFSVRTTGSRTHPWLYAAVPPGLAMRNRDAHPRLAIQLCGDLLFNRDYFFRAGLIVRSVAHLDCNHVLAGADIYYEVELL